MRGLCRRDSSRGLRVQSLAWIRWELLHPLERPREQVSDTLADASGEAFGFCATAAPAGFVEAPKRLDDLAIAARGYKARAAVHARRLHGSAR